MVFFSRIDLLYQFQSCGNTFVAMEYNAGRQNVSLDSHRMRNNDRNAAAQPVLFEEEEFAHHRLYKVHKCRSKQRVYQEYRAAIRAVRRYRNFQHARLAPFYILEIGRAHV